jgi:hypothetical protein
MALPNIGILGKFKTSRVSQNKKNKTWRVKNGLVKITQNVRQNGKLDVSRL